MNSQKTHEFTASYLSEKNNSISTPQTKKQSWIAELFNWRLGQMLLPITLPASYLCQHQDALPIVFLHNVPKDNPNDKKKISTIKKLHVYKKCDDNHNWRYFFYPADRGGEECELVDDDLNDMAADAKYCLANPLIVYQFRQMLFSLAYQAKSNLYFYSFFFERMLKVKSDFKNRLSFQHTFVKVVDGQNAQLASLDTIIIKKKDLDISDTAKSKYIIHFAGNGQCYESRMEEMTEDAEGLDCTVIGFNYRSVGNSQGSIRSKDDLVADGIAQVNALLSQAVLPENIILKGYSIGGGVATLVARHFHQENKKVYLFNERSFSSITNVAVGWIRTFGFNRNAYDESFLGKIIGLFCLPFIKAFLLLTNWEIDAGSAYNKIDDNHKIYTTVRSTDSNRRAEGKPIDDSVITDHGALANSWEHCFNRFVSSPKYKNGEDPREMRPVKNSTGEQGHILQSKDLKNHNDINLQRFFHEWINTDIRDEKKSTSICKK